MSSAYKRYIQALNLFKLCKSVFEQKNFWIVDINMLLIYYCKSKIML